MNRTPPMPPHRFLAQLDECADEVGVRNTLAAGRYSAQHASVAQEWLRQKEDMRRSEADARSDTREETILSVAREANDIARSASFAATAAAVSASEANAIARSNSRTAKRAEIIAAIAAVAAIVAAIAAVVGVK